MSRAIRRGRSLGGCAGRNAMEVHFHRAGTRWNRGFTALCHDASTQHRLRETLFASPVSRTPPRRPVRRPGFLSPWTAPNWPERSRRSRPRTGPPKRSGTVPDAERIGLPSAPGGAIPGLDSPYSSKYCIPSTGSAPSVRSGCGRSVGSLGARRRTPALGPGSPDVSDRHAQTGGGGPCLPTICRRCWTATIPHNDVGALPSILAGRQRTICRQMTGRWHRLCSARFNPFFS